MRWTSGLAAKVCMSSSDQILICLGCITSLWRPELISLRFLLVRLVAELWVTLRGLHTRLGAWVFSLQRGDRVRERERERDCASPTNSSALALVEKHSRNQVNFAGIPSSTSLCKCALATLQSQHRASAAGFLGRACDSWHLVW